MLAGRLNVRNMAEPQLVMVQEDKLRRRDCVLPALPTAAVYKSRANCATTIPKNRRFAELVERQYFSTNEAEIAPRKNDGVNARLTGRSSHTQRHAHPWQRCCTNEFRVISRIAQ
jgi:hypothetical protein